MESDWDFIIIVGAAVVGVVGAAAVVAGAVIIGSVILSIAMLAQFAYLAMNTEVSGS